MIRSCIGMGRIYKKRNRRVAIQTKIDCRERRVVLLKDVTIRADSVFMTDLLSRGVMIMIRPSFEMD